MLAMLEKVINEHGSSSILRERLELFSDKYSILEEKNQHLTERNEQLENQLQQAQEEIARLQEIIDANAAPALGKLDDTETQILQLFFDSNDYLYVAQIAQHISLPTGNAEYHINNLLENNFLHAAYNMRDDTRYRISSEGRAYIVKNT